MKKTNSLKILIITTVIVLTLSLMPVLAYSANETHATFVQDALRYDTMSNGTSIISSLMTSWYDYPIGGNVVNCVGNTADYSSGPYEQYESALKFTLPATTDTLTSATLRLKVVHREGNPTATVTMTNDNSWQQTNDAYSTFPHYSAPVALASDQPVTAENDWQDIPLTDLNALDAKIGGAASDVTLIITGSTISGYYFDFLADDDPSPDPGAELILTFAPIVSSVAVPANGTYKAGDSLNYTVNFNDAVNVTGTPYLTLTVGSSTVHANYLSGSGTNQLTFGYTIAPGDKDSNGVALASNVSLGGGTIRDAAGYDATLTFAGSTAANVQVKASQTITFENPGSQNFGTSPTLTATSDSELPVAFTSDTPDVCTVSSEGALTFLKAGTATISVNQAGNSEYLPAATVSQSFTVNAVVPGAPIIGTATSGNTQAGISFTPPAFTGGAEITGYIVTSSPGDFTLIGAGSPIFVTGLTNGMEYTFTVAAMNSAGTGEASAASNSVTPKAPQTITFENPGAQSFDTHPVLTATSDSTLPVTFTSDTPDVCTVSSDGVLTFFKTGTATIIAHQAGSASYLPAETVSQSFTVNAVEPGAPTISAVTAGNGRATVSFKPPVFTGGTNITGYTVKSSPGGFIATGASSPITVTGLTNGVAYTFTVTATNSAGSGAASSASLSVTPAIPTYTIIASAGRGVDISPSGTVSVTEGSSRAFTITPDAHYRIASVLVDGVNQGAIRSYTFSNVTANHTITVTAKRTPAPTATPTDTPVPTITPKPTVKPTATLVPTPTPALAATPGPAATPAELAAASMGSITGTVLDSSGKPMAGYVIELHSDTMTTVTDANGRYAFQDVDYTSHELIVKTPEGEQIAEFELAFSEGEDFSSDMTKEGVSITYTRSTETVSIALQLIPDKSGATISQVSGSDKPQISNPLRGVGLVLIWIGGGILAVMLIALLITIVRKRKKNERNEIL